MRRIGRYIIRGLLGRGGMSRVYKVELPGIEKTSALKLLDPDPLLVKLLGTDELRRLFINEARTMGAVRHLNVTALLDYDLHHDNPFYVMDFHSNNLGSLIGESYRPDRPSRVLGAERALSYTRQTLSGLSCLHDAGIIHRDIKPYNLLLTAYDTVKICDFGLSKLRGEVFGGPTNLKVGSPFYAAPEQELNPDAAGEKADLYPVGIMLYRMLTGLLPAAAPGRGAYTAPSRLNPDVDDVWDAFIAKSIAPDPEHRFGTAEAMLQSLDDLQRHFQTVKAQTCALPQTDAPPRGYPDKPAVGETGRMRAEPLKVPLAEARAVFRLDQLWRPTQMQANQYKKGPADTVIDHVTGLIWQRAGSPFPRTWEQAHQRVARLNQESYAGLQRWRLPTVDELTSLLRPPSKASDLCLAPVFDARQRWLWSIDRRSFTAAYFVDAELGFVSWQDFSGLFFVRAVCSSDERVGSQAAETLPISQD